MTLVVLLAEHRGPLTADLRRYYGCSLAAALRGEVAPLSEIAAWVANLPPDCATFRAQHPNGEWQHTQQLHLVRETLWESQKTTYYLARRLGVRMDVPERYRFPWEEEEGVIRGDRMTTDQADDWLGWSEEMKAHLTGRADF